MIAAMRAVVMSLVVGLLGGCGDDSGSGEGGSESTMIPTTTMPGTSSTTMAGTSSESGVQDSSGEAGAVCECEDPSRCDDEGRCRRYVFVTRDPIELGPTALDDANAACQAAADSSSMLPAGGDYIAFLAVDDAPPWDLFGLRSLEDAIYVLPGDTVVGTADELEGAQLGMGSLQHAIDTDHDGMPLHGDYEMEACGPDPHGVWTGIEGSLFAGDCNDWVVDADGYTGVVGNALAVDETWTSFCSSGCSMVQAHVYCFEVM